MSIGAGIGIANFTFDDARGFWKWVDMCDAGGVDSIWQSDRIISTQPALECMSVMAALAGATRRIKFGMNVASLGLRDPVIMAKQCATIDVLSEGRLLPAFGIGSARSRDYAATGKPTRRRGKRVNEGLEILTRLWTEDKVDFQGEFYRLDARKHQSQTGAAPTAALARRLRATSDRSRRPLGHGLASRHRCRPRVAPVVAAIKARARELGRVIDEDHYDAGFGFRFGTPSEPIVGRHAEVLRERLGRDARGYAAVGGADEIMALLKRFHEAGVHKFVLRPIASGTEDMLAQTRALIDQVLPEVAAMNGGDG